MVEKEGKKDLGKVVTGGGEGTEAEGTEKANHREHGGHGEKQTTEDTQKSKPQRGRAATKQVWRHKKSSRAEKNLRASSTENTENTEKNKPRGTRRWEKRERKRWGGVPRLVEGWR